MIRLEISNAAEGHSVRMGYDPDSGEGRIEVVLQMRGLTNLMQRAANSIRDGMIGAAAAQAPQSSGQQQAWDFDNGRAAPVR